MPLFTPRKLFQVKPSKVTVDKTTSSVTFIELLSDTISTAGGDLILLFSAVVSGTTGSLLSGFQLTLDGTEVKAITLGLDADGRTVLIMVDVSVAAGDHTVAVNWKTTLGTIRIRPVTTGEYGNILMLEVQP